MAFLQVAFDSLASKAVIDYYRREKLDVKLLKNLKIRMLAINQLIDDAEDKEATNLALKEWLDELKDVVFDTEDVLDVIATQAHENEVSSTTPWNPFDRSLHQELEDVLYRMKCLLKQKKVFGLKPSTRSNSTSETLRPPTTSLVEKSCVYGRAVDKEEIKKLLLSNDGSNIGDVIAIVGMGGLGKSTLAQFVFNDYQINSVFKLNKVWICVAEDFDVIKITKTILEKMTSQPCYTDDFDQIQMKLKESLSGKRFLIALDDVWNENERDWDELRKPFNFGAPGSKIMVTTRNTRVASAMRAISTYKLQVLSNEDCWLLFAKHAFENISLSSHSKFEVVGRKLVKKCQGLPLAARVLGGLLRMKVAHTEEWDEVLNNDIWNSSDEESESKILPVLRLSYLYLPSHLKRCFSFCSLIPKDYEFEREKIVMLWMAESLLPVHRGKKRIDIGYEYLGDLESRSLIQASIEGKSHFAMHDLVNDLATAVSGDFYKRCDIGNSFEVGKQTRHFSYLQDYKYKENDLARLQVISEAKRLRSLMPLGNGWRLRAPHIHSKILPQLKLIRTLILSRSNIEKIHDSIGNLKLLHYLDLSCNPKLNQLPESLARLYNLEVLILAGCRSLTKLPSKISQLTKLNYLNITRTTRLKEMPLQMGRLNDLDVLTGFVLGKDSGSSIAELKELTYLRGQLSIRGLQNITHPEDALVANLQEKSYLEELWLEWDTDHGHSEDARIILENLRPHVNLKRLSIWQYSGTRLPNWSGHYSFVNLVYIKLVGFKHLFDLSPLGQLPYLKSLSIFFGDSLVTLLGTEIQHRVGHFSALVNLDIFDCPKLELPQHHRFASVEDFTLYGGSCASLQFFPLSLFPNLKRLCLKETKSLESLVVINEVNNINLEHLEAIEIRSCPNFEYLNDGKWCSPKMKFLELQECESFKDLPENMCSLFPSLESLSLYQCPKLEAFPKGGLPSSLRNLKISGFECDDLESFPEDGLLHSSLSSLLIEDVPHLRSLNGKSFQLLTSLEKLELSNCPNLLCLPELPTSLSSLIIRYCPLLESRCQREQGKDWSKIAHIPNILVGL